jgi:hypothetical protein
MPEVEKNLLQPQQGRYKDSKPMMEVGYGRFHSEREVDTCC